MKRHASMNRIYRLVWSQITNTYVAVAECAKGRGKSISGRKLVAAALALTNARVCGDENAKGHGRSNLAQKAIVGCANSMLLVGGLLLAPAAMAYTQATVSTQVGDLVTDPGTGIDAAVSTLVQDNGITYAVVTTSTTNSITTYELIYTALAVGGIVADPSGSYTVTSTNIDATTGLVSSVDLSRIVIDVNGNNVTETPTLTMATVQDAAFIAALVANAATATPGDAGGYLPAPVAQAGDTNNVYNVQTGASGSHGNNGFGVHINLGFTSFTIGYSGSSGGVGDNGPNIIAQGPLVNITTSSDGVAGIRVASIGGNGGDGGNSYGYIPGLNGGNGGSGGNVQLTTNAASSIVTSGKAA
ncbi:MAG: ESPR domain-containing protein, partial [Sulfuriferula sp.]